MTARLQLGREQILAFRRRVGALDERLPRGRRSLRRAAWAGLQDSMPRAALLSIHARVAGAEPSTWEDPSLVQVWGPRFSAFVVAAVDRAVFTLGRMPEAGNRRRRAEDLVARLEPVLDGTEMTYGEAGRAIGEAPNMLRYATLTGRVLIRWDGARQPTIRLEPAPDMDAGDARRELVRRYLHVFGPGTADSFAGWAGVKPAAAAATFAALERSLAPVRTPIGEGWILSSDEEEMTAPSASPAPARLLPSGDTYYLLQGLDRELLVPDAERRPSLWTSRVWPGAVLVEGEIVGTWRRSHDKVTIEAWRPLHSRDRETVEEEATSLPLPGVDASIEVRWEA